MPSSRTLSVRGHRVTTRTDRRWIVVAVRPKAVVYDDYTYPAFVRVLKRTDSIDTARAEQRKFGFPPGSFAVIMDKATGKEVTD